MNSREQSLGLRGQRGWRPGGRAGAVARGLPLRAIRPACGSGTGPRAAPRGGGGHLQMDRPVSHDTVALVRSRQEPDQALTHRVLLRPVRGWPWGHVPRPTSQRGLCHLGCRLQMPAVQPAPRAVMGHTPLGPLPPRSPSGATGLTHAPCLSPHTGAPGFLMAGTTSSDQLTTD